MYTLLGDVDFSDRKTETLRPSGRKLYHQIRIHTNLKRSYPSAYFKLTIILIRNWPSPSFEIDPISNCQVIPIFIRNRPCCEMIVNRQKYTFMKNHTLILIKYYDRMLSVERSWTFRKWSNNFSLKIVYFKGRCNDRIFWDFFSAKIMPF